MMERRALVVEHRVTVKTLVHKIRFWIEGDAGHGGLIWPEEAERAAKMAVRCLGGYDGLSTETYPEALAIKLLEMIPSANSVEVCDLVTENGVAVHRDWP